IPGPRRLVAGPGGLLHAGEHHALVGIGGLLVGPDIPVAVGRVRRASCVAKPGMRIRGVVDDEIDDDADAALPATMGEFDEVPERAVAWIDAVIIRDVVTVVLAGRRLERHQPERGNAKPLQIVQPPHQTLEIADAVAVGVHIGADGEAIYYAVLVPEIIDHAEAAFLVRTRFKAATYKRREFTGFPRAAGVSGRQTIAVGPAKARFARINGALCSPPWNQPAMSTWCRRRTAASRRPRWRSRAAPRGCCGRWGFPASANCRCR